MRISVFGIVFAVLAACAPARSAPRAGALDGDGPIVLVAHPAPYVMKRMQFLLDQGLLAIPNVRVVGVAHASELGDYGPTEAYVARMPRLGFHRVDCPLDHDALFQKNGCTEVFEQLIERSVGIVFPGGPDIPPRFYGEPTLLTTVIETPNRIAWEASLLYHLVGRGKQEGAIPFLARRPDYPVLAICMGMQALNVASGGTLIQDIPSEIYGKKTYEEILEQARDEVHRSVHIHLLPEPGMAWVSLHAIRPTPGTTLAALVDGNPTVLSAHHQAAEKIGAGLRVIATSMDGKVVEAVEHEQFKNVLGVQFHPDYVLMWTPEEPFYERPGGSGNVAAEHMSRDQQSNQFHRALWQLFSKRAAGG